MIKSVSLIIAGLLLLLPGFFTDFLGLLLLLPPVQKHLTLKLMPHLRVWRGRGGSTGAATPTAATPSTANISAKTRIVSVTIKIAECKRGGVSRPFCCLFRHLLRKRKCLSQIFLPLKAPFLPLSLSPRGRNPQARRSTQK